MIVVLLFLSALTAFYIYLKWIYGYWSRNNVPGPEPSLLVGNIWPILTFKIQKGSLYEDWYRWVWIQYPSSFGIQAPVLYMTFFRTFTDVPYFGFYKLMTPGIILRDPALIKNVLIKDFSSFHKNDFKVSKRFDPLMSKHPVCLFDDEWRTERKCLTPPLSAAKVWDFEHFFVA